MPWFSRNVGPIILIVSVFLMGYMVREIFDLTQPIQIKTIVQERDGPLQQQQQQQQQSVVVENSIPAGPIPEVINFVDGKWVVDDQICKNIDDMIDKPKFKALTFHSKIGKFPIYVHDTKADSVSTEIAISGTFEPGSFVTIMKILNEDPEMNVIDVGTNIGVLSIQFAKMGRKVLSLEAAEPNIQHYCASVRLNKIQDKVTIVHNAVTDDHEPIQFILGKGGEFGVSFMDGPGYRENKLAVSKVKKFDLENPLTIKSVMMDDLLTLPIIKHFKKVFLKLDTEGAEDKVLLGAKELFKQLDVRGVFMEWRFHKTNPHSRARLLAFMKEHNFVPCNLRGNERVVLDVEKLSPHDILWLSR